MYAAGKFWKFNFNKKEFLCYTTHNLNAIDPQFMFTLVFDISDKENVLFYYYADYLVSDYKPNIGIIQRANQEELCIKQTDYNFGNIETHFFVIPSGYAQLLKEITDEVSTYS
jgi:hypothetical protein